jgi:hypothetical protein
MQPITGTDGGSTARRRRRHPWTKRHTYYALMGGFVFHNYSDIPDASGFTLPRNRDRLTLTPLAIQFLAGNEPDLIPDISEAHIKDKSKSTWLTKSLVLAQALWFCLQVITRLAQGLPITVLELNTLAHVFYAFFTFAVWWKKPLDVEEPTEIVLEDERVMEICAAMCASSSIGYRFPCLESKTSTAILLVAEDEVKASETDDQPVAKTEGASDQQLTSESQSGSNTSPAITLTR